MESSEPPSYIFYILLLLVLIIFSMFFSSSETAFMSASKLRIRYLKEKKNPQAIRVDKILQKKDTFLNAVLIGNNIVNIGLSALITTLAIELFGSSSVAVATACATVVILIFGEILPKSISLLRPEKTALTLSLPIHIFLGLASPIVSVFTFITKSINYVFGIRGNKHKTTVTEEDLKAMIEVGEEEGLIESPKRAMMHRIFKYTDLTAKDIMTPRTDIATLNIDTPRKEILALSHKSCYSRFPVYGENIDDIKGILYIKDFLFAPDTNDQKFSISNLLRPALFIFETQKMSILQEKLRASNQNMAIIIDEFGGTSGIVSMADLVEKIFGGIQDEFDIPIITIPDPEKTDVKKTDAWLLDGTDRLDEINERYALQLTSDYYDSIGGYIMEKSEEMPVEGSVFKEMGLTLTVVSVSGNRIEKVKLELSEAGK